MENYISKAHETKYDAIAVKVVEAVCSVYGCDFVHVVSITDTIFKKIVVYILVKNYNVDVKYISKTFRIGALYVPTVVTYITEKIGQTVFFKMYYNEILKKIDL